VALRDTPYDTGLDLSLLSEVAEYFKGVRKKYKRFETVYSGVNTKTLVVQIPGGMISNLANQLKEQSALDKMNEVFEEIPRVRKDMGYPPLVTPTSQVVGTQATLNVLTGERYKVITSETRNYFRGLYGSPYGSPPGKISPQARKKAIGGKKVITCRPADLLELELDRLTRETKGKARSVEDVLTYALFPIVAMEYFEQREARSPGRDTPRKANAHFSSR
jgi:pyruvate carboxylase subunit B